MTNQLMKPFFSGFDELHQALDRLLDRNFLRWEKEFPTQEMTYWEPKIDVKEKDSTYVIRADIPGVNPKAIEINFENGILTIKGKKESETKEEKENYVRVERSSGSFYRAINLPEVTDTSKIEAKSKNGVLEITVPKTKKSSAPKIQIKEE